MYRPTHIAAVAPTVNDDITEGFHRGNYWWDTVTQTQYILEDEADGAAVWVIVAGGGSLAWANWIPVVTFTGGAATPTYVARYQTVNNTVYFTLLLQAANTSGSTTTAVSCTLPVTPKDNNMFIPINAQYAMSTLTARTDIYGTQMWIIDCYNAANRDLFCIPSFSLLNGETYTWIMSGFYETE